MKRGKSDRSLFIGGWILLGFLILGLNGYQMLALMDSPLAGYSESARLVDRGIRQLKTLLTAENENIEEGLKQLSGRHAATGKGKALPKRKAPKPSGDPLPESTSPVSLPVLAGILSRWSTNGAVEHLAMLDGRVCVEGDWVGDLIVQEISSRGVRLVRGDNVWFVRTPDAGHSVVLQ